MSLSRFRTDYGKKAKHGLVDAFCPKETSDLFFCEERGLDFEFDALERPFLELLLVFEIESSNFLSNSRVEETF